MFGLDQRPFGNWTWEELTKELKQADETAWLDSLGILMKDGIESRDIKPCLPVFSSKHTKSLYRPYIYRIDRLPEKSVRFIICFLEIPSEEDPKPSGNLGTITALLSLGRKFRWGIFRKYEKPIKEAAEGRAAKNNAENAMKELDLALNSLESKAVNMGLNDRSEILQEFGEVDDRK